MKSVRTRFIKIFIMIAAIIIASVSAVSSAECAEGRKYALLIGINDYSGSRDFASLDGCRNDVELMEELLAGERFGFEDIRKLEDSEATHSNILAAIEKLADVVERDDIVYIHFSGHGSRTLDLNGDEYPNLFDSTLVAFGARERGIEVTPEEYEAVGRGAAASREIVNDFDIVDDRLDQVLSLISAKTQNLVFVADSCHSGTITRGEGIAATRGGDSDPRPHIDGNLPLPPDNVRRSWVAIGAARDEEQAREYIVGEGDDKITYGAFTWFWARALSESSGEDTWRMVFDRTSAMIKAAGFYHQTPVIQGDDRLQILGGRVDRIPLEFTVARIYPEIEINAGTFAGISEGSEFEVRKSDAESPDITLTVKRARPYSSEVTVEGGEVNIGDIVVLTKWVPSYPSTKVAVLAEFEEDETRASELRDIIINHAALAAYEYVNSPDEGEMLLLVTRPERDGNREIVMVAENSPLPETDRDAEPLVFMLDSSQSSFYGGIERLITSFEDEELETLVSNMERFARLKGFKNLRVPSAGGEGLIIYYRLFVAATDEEYDALPDDKRIHFRYAEGQEDDLKVKESRVVRAEETIMERTPEEIVLAVRVENKSNSPYHIYGLNATDDAKIFTFLPVDLNTYTVVQPNETRDFVDHALDLTENNEYVRVIAALQQANVHFLTQDPVVVRSSAEGRGLNPIEIMLMQTLTPTRGGSRTTSAGPTQMATVHTSFVIAAGDTEE